MMEKSSFADAAASYLMTQTNVLIVGHYMICKKCGA